MTDGNLRLAGTLGNGTKIHYAREAHTGRYHVYLERIPDRLEGFGIFPCRTSFKTMLKNNGIVHDPAGGG